MVDAAPGTASLGDARAVAAVTSGDRGYCITKNTGTSLEPYRPVEMDEERRSSLIARFSEK